MIKIDIVSGFLGSGKTTMIRKLMDEGILGKSFAIIENDFGDINIDSDRLKKSGVEIRSISSGCICCTLSGDFKTAIDDLIKEHRPKRIVIEPTGVGRLSDVISVINKVKESKNVELNMAMTIIDVVEFEDFIEVFGGFFIDQIKNANIIVISKSQLVTESVVNKVISTIKDINSKANIIAKPWDELRFKDVINRDIFNENHEATIKVNNHNYECYDEHSPDKKIIEESLEYVTISTTNIFSKVKLESIISSLNTSLYGKVFRAKGSILSEERKWLDFDFLPKNISINEGKVKTIGQVTVIGKDLNRNAIKKLFQGIIK